ncbi:hypothetical protein C9374_007574 [Naegleria lovaniensis]|uniref:RZ-type domain-containing protein n=1 Tax=Naegleria lovaniensis TaxID=51637 RepID=A0AA88GM09_NAELO|nr:uncharacterized protein C9374_007574 [Naegleria lovaniensis]KAG2378936.1 hypothetical protein C9374_007574 [Naegleria lovaniensis]
MLNQSSHSTQQASSSSANQPSRPRVYAATSTAQENAPTRQNRAPALLASSSTSSQADALLITGKSASVSEHENKRFSQVILMCSKCRSNLAVNSTQRGMFKVFKEGQSKHLVLFDQSVIGKTIIEKEMTNSQQKDKTFEKTHLLFCSSCQEKIGCRLSGCFPNTDLPKRMFDGESCQVTCTEKDTQEQVVMNVKEWRKLRYSLKDFSLYPPPQANFSSTRYDPTKAVKESTSGRKADERGMNESYQFVRMNDNNVQQSKSFQPSQNTRTRAQHLQPKEVNRTNPMKSYDVVDIFDEPAGRSDPSTLSSSSFTRKSFQVQYPTPQIEKLPTKEKKVYTIQTVRDLHRYIDCSLLKEGNEQYFIKNLFQDLFKSIFGTEGVLQQYSIDFKLIEKLLMVFSHREIEVTTNKTQVTTMFSLLMNSSFWRRDVKKYIMNDVVDDEQIETIITIFQRCLDFCPLEAERVYIEELEKIYIEKFLSQTFKESIENLKSKKKHVLKSNNSIADEPEEDDLEGIDIDIGIFPTWNELTSNNKFTIKNIVDRSYPSLKHYLYTQIMLLREDFIHPLKEGIRSFLSNELNHRIISVFTDVQFRSVISLDNERELVHSLSFNYPWKKVNWECSKKLAFGSLLCLFPQEGFGKNATLVKSEPIFVTVVGRQHLRTGQIYVTVCREEDYARLSFTGMYIMFESPVYFASVRPVIDALKMIRSENLLSHSKFSFYDEFIKVKTQKPPQYVEKVSVMSLDVISGKSRKSVQSNVSVGQNIDIMSDWIDDNDTFLDSSQNSAIKHVMRNRVAIVIGPPGTGKTFTGIEVAKLMKSHPYMKERQLVCITYTNHALDQFLEGLLDYFPDLVRVGSRSKSQNEKLLARNISNLRYLPKYLLLQKKHCEAELNILTKEIGSIEQSIKNPDESLYHIICKSMVFKKALIKFPTHLYTKRNPAPHSFLDMFNCWLNGDDLRRMEYLRRNNFINHLGNSFSALRDQNNEVELEIFEEVKLEETKAVEFIEEIEIPEERIEQEIEVELIEEEMNNRFGYDEADFTNATSIFNYYWEFGYDTTLDPEIARIEDEVKQFGDIYRIPLEKRKSMMKRLTSLNEEVLRKRLVDFIKKRSYWEARKREILIERDYLVLSDASIIGLTSTAASMNRNLLNRLRAPIYLIEEAAELLECQITSVLHPNVQHLVMIGDEKQLQPKVNSYYLEKNCDFTVSLFERLIRNGLKYVSLNIQQRMRPEIRGLIDMFYEKLTDHECVTKFEHVTGVSTNICFIEHKKPEKTSEDIQSLTNPHEAEFLSKFCKYLLNVRQYKANNITILTPYRGQVILIKKTLKELIDQQQYNNIRVSTVDDYQGEENEIILLSLVRSNNYDNLGFVKITNRIIVSLSRARKGLYIIGNYDLLRNNEDWRKIFSRLKLSNRILDHLPLSCPKHTEEKECIREPHDFDQVIWGGCKKPCTYRYDCGHICSLPCHHDSLHQERKCEKICDEKHAECGHRCKAMCHSGKSCPKCTTLVNYKFVDCGHTTQIKCYLKDTAQLCKERCQKPLKCGHICNGECGSCKLTGCGPCQTTIKDTCETCKRSYSRKCSDPRICTNPCTFKLTCGHNCSGKCGDCTVSSPCTHKTCGFNCERTLICGHICKVKHTCSTPCSKCEETCVFKCFHKVKCELSCHEMCYPCKEACPIRCSHRQCSNLCSEPCDIEPCNERCPNKCLQCGTPCMGLCGEPCPPCMHCAALNGEVWQCPISFMNFEDLTTDERVYYLPECGHIFELESMDNCVRTFFETEQGISIKYLSCPCCRTPIFTAPRYQKSIKECVKRMEHLKYIIYKKEEEEKQARKDAIRIVSAEAGYASGHWFCCENGHPYFIGECGGAMQQSVCVDCGAPVGGSSHRLLSSNRLATDIDGATAPAWPTALNQD